MKQIRTLNGVLKDLKGDLKELNSNQAVVHLACVAGAKELQRVG